MRRGESLCVNANPQHWRSVLLGPLAIAIFVFAVPGPVAAQAVAGRSPVQDLLEWAESLPIEFRADIQLNAIESGRVGQKQAAEILERLFRDAGGARYPYKQTELVRRSGTRQRKLATAFSLNLDALSIRGRIIRALLSINPERAHSLLEDVRLEIAPVPCTSAMVPDVGEFYGVVAAVLGRSPAATDGERDQSVALLEGQLRQITSPVQLAPVADLLARAELNPRQMVWLTSLYADVLSRISTTDRELAAVEQQRGLSSAIGRLAARHAEQALHVLPLLHAYRAFVMRAARAEQCGDITVDREKLAESFNHLREGFGNQQTLRQLQAEELKPERVGGVAVVDTMADREDFVTLLDRVMTRREIALRKPTESPELESAGWESDVAQFLTKIDGLDPLRADCRSCIFHEKADLFFIFFDFTPVGHFKQRILMGLADFLANSTMQDEAPLEWLIRVKLLLNLSRKPTEEQLTRIRELERQGKVLTMLPSEAAAQIAETMKTSGNYVLYVYVVADEILGNEYILPPF
jgi:hypothetical protein